MKKERCTLDTQSYLCQDIFSSSFARIARRGVLWTRRATCEHTHSQLSVPKAFTFHFQIQKHIFHILNIYIRYSDTSSDPICTGIPLNVAYPQQIFIFCYSFPSNWKVKAEVHWVLHIQTNWPGLSVKEPLPRQNLWYQSFYSPFLIQILYAVKRGEELWLRSASTEFARSFLETTEFARSFWNFKTFFLK